MQGLLAGLGQSVVVVTKIRENKQCFIQSFCYQRTTDTMTKLPVYLRLKPKSSNSSNEAFLRLKTDSKPGDIPSHQVIVDPPKDSRYKAEEIFSFNGLFRETSTQVDVYQGAVKPIVEHVVQGTGDGLFFAIGASGSGKSHTILGYRNIPGMIHLAVDNIYRSLEGKMADFEEVESLSDLCNPDRTSSAAEAGIMMDWTRKTAANTGSTFQTSKALAINNLADRISSISVSDEYRYAVYVSIVEIYNDRVFDLLDTNSSTGVNAKPTPRRALPIKIDQSNGKVYLSNAKKLFASDKIEAFKTIEEGLSRRIMHSTGSNMTSSRSHAFITIEIKKINSKVETRKSVTSTTLNIVDLAGSERVKESRTNGSRLIESGAINKSLMLLGQCLQKQRDREDQKCTTSKMDSSIFRNSRLTQLLLSNAFNMNISQKSSLLVNVDPYGEFSATSQVLRYSALARQVTIPKTRIPSLNSVASAAARAVSSSSTMSAISARSVSSASSVSSAASSVRDGHTHTGNKPRPRPLTASKKVNMPPEKSEMEQLIESFQVQLSEAHEQAFLIEEQVRQEMADEMDRQIQELHKYYKAMIANEYDRGQNYTDKKLELLADTVKKAEYTSLIDENDILKLEIEALRQENEMLQSSLYNADMEAEL